MFAFLLRVNYLDGVIFNLGFLLDFFNLFLEIIAKCIEVRP